MNFVVVFSHRKHPPGLGSGLSVDPTLMNTIYSDLVPFSTELFHTGRRNTANRAMAINPKNDINDRREGITNQKSAGKPKNREPVIAARARGPDRAALAREGYQALEAARRAGHPRKAVLEQAAGQVALDLALDEIG